MKWLTPLITALGFTVVVFVLVDRLPKMPAPTRADSIQNDLRNATRLRDLTEKKFKDGLPEWEQIEWRMLQEHSFQREIDGNTTRP